MTFAATLSRAVWVSSRSAAHRKLHPEHQLWRRHFSGARRSGGCHSSAVQFRCVWTRASSEIGPNKATEGNAQSSEETVQRSLMLRKEGGSQVTILEPASYCSIKTDEYEFLIAMDSEGRLNLRRCFVVDDMTGISSQAEVGGGVPDKFLTYMAVPWQYEDPGDIIMDKKPSVKVTKWYYLESHDSDSAILDIDQAYLFDIESRSVSRQEILKGPDWDADDAYLRFLEDGRIILQSSESTPPPGNIVQQNWEKFVKEGGLTHGTPLDTKTQVDEEEFEYDIDVPEVDMS